jgi:hypothetical protein
MLETCEKRTLVQRIDTKLQFMSFLLFDIWCDLASGFNAYFINFFK